MLKLPKNVLQKLQCAQCDNYLNSPPLVIKDGEQICGKCFEILPDDEKPKCVRQIGLETVSELLIFPCKYQEHGCDYTYLWNAGDDHKIYCTAQNNAAPPPATSTETEFTCNSEDVSMIVKYETLNSVYSEGDDVIKLNVDIVGNKGKTLFLTDLQGNKEKQDVTVNIKGVLTSRLPPNLLNFHISLSEAEQISEHHYESIVYHNICQSCRIVLRNDGVFRCISGHCFCKTCKPMLCPQCNKLIVDKSMMVCKNVRRGCLELFTNSTTAEQHERNCKFNTHKCLFLDCNFAEALDKVVSHFITAHKGNIIFYHELQCSVTLKDKKLYFYCYNKIFIFQYYYFDGIGEFIVRYVGANDKAQQYKYQITISDDITKSRTKCISCLGWNEVSLAKPISFNFDENNLSKIKVHVSILCNLNKNQ